MLNMRSTIFLTVICVAATATADDELARRHYDQGVKLYNLQDWTAALGEFKSAYVEHADPVFLFNIAQSQRQLGQFDAAAKSYRAYLNQLPDAANRDEVQARIRDMDAAEQQRIAKQPPTGLVAPAAVTETVTAAPTRRPWYRNPAGMSLAAVGVGAVAVGAALLGQSAVDENGARHASTLPDQTRLQNDAGTFTTAGAVTIGIGGAALVVGAIILAVQR